MNGKQLDSIEKKARRVAQNDVSIIASEDKKGHITGYAITVDGHRYGTPESFYEAFPELAPRKQERVYGPYRVKNIGVNGDVYEVVEMVDNVSTTWQELRPRKTYLNRQSAYGKCLRLNRQWQKQLNPDEMELLEYWKKATN